jgi:hypothetical protein
MPELALFLVGLFRVVDLLSNEFQALIGSALEGAVEAGLVTDVALAGIDGYLEDKAVLIAIDQNLLDLLAVPALFALSPQFAAGSAEICAVAGSNGLVKRLTIHVGDHQDLAGRRVLGDGRYKAIIIESWQEFEVFFKLFLCAQLNGSSKLPQLGNRDSNPD